MRKIIAALFDVDGTLLNTAEFVYQAFVHTFQTHGLPGRSTDEIAAVTTRSRRTSIKTLEMSCIIDYFDAIISGEDVNYPKPHPEPLFKALQQLEVGPEKAVMIGDTEADILAGKNAKVMTIGVSYGFHGSHIVGSKPDFIVEDIVDIIPILLPDPKSSRSIHFP